MNISIIMNFMHVFMLILSTIYGKNKKLSAFLYFHQRLKTIISKQHLLNKELLKGWHISYGCT
ncbi:hypothetical protein [Niallia sp. 03133]|uniref:hypothetical protein n=1 Tax=Niallia sp. 03133 TaxID=3458060 RepID=UPI004044AEFE